MFLTSAISRTARALLVALLLSPSSSLFSQTQSVSQTQLEAVYAKAEDQVRQGQWESGLELLKQVMAADPRNLKALNLMGIALTGQGNLAEGNKQFQRALQVDPRFVPALKNLAINEFSQHDVANAERHLLSALEIAPEDPVVNSYLGEIAYTRKQYREAATRFEKAGELRSNPGVGARLVVSYLESGQQDRGLASLRGLQPEKVPAQLQFAIGLALARRELFRQAAEQFAIVLGKHPDSYDTAFNLATCNIEAQQFAAAITVLHDLSALGHDTAEVENLLAEAYEGNNQTQEAIDALRKATELAPEDEENYLDLANLCTKYAAYDLGLQIIEVGLHHHPRSDRLIFQRGVIHAMLNKGDLADQDFQLANRLAPEKNMSYVALGVSYMASGDLPKATELLRQRIRKTPSDAILRYLLGEALLRSGAAPGAPTFLEAKTTLEAAIRLNPKLAAARVNLAKIYLKENRLDEAVGQLEQARELDPKDKSVYSQLAIVYRRKGNTQAAIAMLATLNQLNDEDRKAEGHRKRLRAIEESR